jgi:Tfp pilus assembly PilM family ATPase
MSFLDSLQNNVEKITEHFPVPRYLSFNPVALDFSPDSIRVMKLKNFKFGYRPVFYKEVKVVNESNFTQDAFSEKDKDNIVAILKKLKAEFNFKYVVTSLPEQKNYLYRVKIPKAALPNFASAVKFSLEENVPLSAEDVNFDYKILNIDNKYVDTIVSVFPKNVIKIYSDIFKKSNIVPISFQAESDSVVKSVIKNSDKKLYLVVRMLENQINVAITEGHAVQYTTSIFLSSKEISESIYGESSKLFIKELSRVLVYWFTSKKDTDQNHKIENAIIVGEYAKTEGLIEFLEDGLKIDFEIGNVWTNCFDLENYIPELLKNESLNFSVAIGLALRSINYR